MTDLHTKLANERRTLDEMSKFNNLFFTVMLIATVATFVGAMANDSTPSGIVEALLMLLITGGCTALTLVVMQTEELRQAKRVDELQARIDEQANDRAEEHDTQRMRRIRWMNIQ